MKDTLTAPTAKELAKGPTVTLTRPGWINYSWSPHGFAYPIRFNSDGKATILTSHFDAWLGVPQAAVYGIVVTDKEKAPNPQVEVDVCPTCGASGDNPCLTTAGKPASAPHKNRP